MQCYGEYGQIGTYVYYGNTIITPKCVCHLTQQFHLELASLEKHGTRAQRNTGRVFDAAQDLTAKY